MKKFAASLTSSELQLARKIEAAGLATFSQAVKAIERDEQERIEEWKRQLESKSSSD